MTTETEPKILDCGHPEGEGTPYNGGMGWKSVIDTATGRNICHACADLRVLDCGHTPSLHAPFTTGYGTDSATGGTFCYACAADRDRADMIASGRATLYLIDDKAPVEARRLSRGVFGVNRSPHCNVTRDPFGARITNWPNSLSFDVRRMTISRHNIAGKRYDAWFTGPDGWEWHAVTYGDNTQIAHCRRVTSRHADGRRIKASEAWPELAKGR